MTTFSAMLEIIGINPYVPLPETVLEEIFAQAGKRKGHVPVRGTVNGEPFRQTLVRYAGAWRLYINMTMLANSPRRIGEVIEVGIEYDPEERTEPIPPIFIQALMANTPAKQNFEKLTPSRQKEIVRYLANLKTAESLQHNLLKIMTALEGAGDFFGRKLAGK